jgi:hypothetical protein
MPTAKERRSGWGGPVFGVISTNVPVFLTAGRRDGQSPSQRGRARARLGHEPGGDLAGPGRCGALVSICLVAAWLRQPLLGSENRQYHAHSLLAFVGRAAA